MSDTRRPTLHIPSLTGAWKQVFADREALHRDAEGAVLAAWADCVADADVPAAADATVQSLVGRTFETADVPGQPTSADGRKRRLDVIALTVAAILYRMGHGASWATLRAVLAQYLTDAWRAGWEASRALTGGDEEAPTPPGMTSSADEALRVASRWTIKGAAKAAAAVLVAASTSGSAVKRITKALLAFLRDPLGLRLAIDQAISEAYRQGMTAHQQASGVVLVDWVTAGDTAVCTLCADAEADGPYPIDQAPEPPAHPRCRCIRLPAAT